MFYALYNKTLNQKLTHPIVGLWNTNNFDDAKELLIVAKEYAECCRLKHEIIIINAETGEQIG